jgi:hypothetical protein
MLEVYGLMSSCRVKVQIARLVSQRAWYYRQQ